MHDFAYLLPVTVICELIGIPESDREGFRPVARDLAGVFEITTSETLPAINAAAVELLAYFTALAAAARADPRDDLLSDLLAVSDADDGRLTDAELLHNLTLLLVAGLRDHDEPAGQRPAGHPAGPAGRRRRAGTARSRRPPSSRKCCASTRPSSSPAGSATTPRWAACRVDRTTGVITLLGAGNRDPRRFTEPGPVRPDAPRRRAAQLRRRRALLHRRRAGPARGRGRLPPAAGPVPEDRGRGRAGPPGHAPAARLRRAPGHGRLTTMAPCA